MEVKADSLLINKNSQVTVESNGQGNGGNLFIQADSLNLEDDALLNASTFSGEGGNIILQIDKFLSFKDNSTISAEAFNNANGGNLTIDARFIIAFPNQNNDIVANAAQGRGGNIDITTEGIFGIEEHPLNPFTNDINASSQFGLDGEITLNLINTDIFQETAEIPRKIVEIDNVSAGVCDPVETVKDILAGTENTFVVNGRGGVPPTPIEPIPSEILIINGQSIEPDAQAQGITEAEEKTLQEQYPPIMTSQGVIYPARGIVKNPDGTVILTAYPTEHTQRIPNNSLNCSN